MVFSRTAWADFLRSRVGCDPDKYPLLFSHADETDPEKVGWMQGCPPPPGKIIQFADGSFFRFPQSRWSFCHWREFVPTKNVFRGFGPPSNLEQALVAMDDITFTDRLGNTLDWRQSLALNYTDGILILHQGKIVYEKYFGALSREMPHISFSITKSIIGVLATMLIHQGDLDATSLAINYVPELTNTAYEDATVQQILDMTVGVKYSEVYADPQAEIWDYHRAGSPLTGCPGYRGPKNYYEFLRTLKKEGEHGATFAYKTVNAEVLAWILRRVTGDNLADLLSKSIWSKIGAEQDAYFQIDTIGTEQAGGGLCVCLRDLARFGEMMRLNGYYNGQRIIPEEAINHILRGGDKRLFARSDYAITLAGWSYRDMWWISHNEHGAYMARGIHGQNLYIDPKAEMVIARYASHPIATNIANDPITIPAYMAVAKYILSLNI
ncbi:MAG: beta-lactamase family protein [Syntrophales bacterium]|nr:beta-lactamase family protein [Syntrophales bacterium]